MLVVVVVVCGVSDKYLRVFARMCASVVFAI